MKVAFNIEQLLQPAPGGIGTYCRALVSRFSARPDIAVQPFIALHSRSVARRVLSDLAGAEPPAVVPVPRPLLYDSWHTLRFPPLRWFGQGLSDVDVIHAPSVAVPPRDRTPLVVTVHDVAPLLFPETFPRRGVHFHGQGLKAAQRADLVITVSQAAAREIRENTGIDPGRVRVVPNGVDPAVVDSASVANARTRYRLGDAPFVLWVGTLEPRKNVGTLVAAFARVVKSTDLPHDLVLVGPTGWLESELIGADMGAALGRRLRTIGPVPETDLQALYEAADAVAVPSIHEGFGLPVLEAMAHGTPVLHSSIPALDEVAGSAGCAVDPLDVSGWSDALVRVLTDPPVAERLTAAGRLRAAEFTWERCAESTLDVYREAIG